MDEESYFLPHKCGRRVDGGVDRISQLPDDIIVDILSFLRLRRAVTTSVLSSRWLDLWKHIPHLKFDRYILPDNYTGDWDARRCKCIEIVNSVIRSHKALSLEKFRILLSVRKSDKCSVTKWLEFVFSKQVESLELNFLYEDEFVLEELLRESRICLQPQTDLIFFQSLKRLRLRCLKVSGEDIELFLRTCPLLEQLTMECVTLTSDVEVCGAKLMLKHLDISFCTGEKSIKVSAPNLTHMRFGALGERQPKLLLENVPKLVEADFSRQSPDMLVQCFASSASYHFSQLQILNLKLSRSKMLFQLQDILANQMPNLKKLVIFCYKTHNHSLLPVTTALIWGFPRLEEFKLTYYDPSWEEHPAYMPVITDIGRSPHQHLKVFLLQMSGRQNVSDDIADLVMYISDNCVALRKIIIGLSSPDDPANRDLIRQRLQGKVPNNIDLKIV